MTVSQAADRSAARYADDQARRHRSSQETLPHLYERLRLRVSPIAIVFTFCIGTITGWPNGPWVPISCSVIFLHAAYIHRKGLQPGATTLLIDGAAIGAITLTMAIPAVTATGLCFYAVVASVLTSGKRFVLVAIYTAIWVAVSLLWAYGGFKGPYEPESKVIIELAAVIFFTSIISLVVAIVMTQLRRADRERAQAAQALAETNAQLEDMIAAKDRFVASVSHELRTPLTTVIGLAQELGGPAADFSADDLREFHQMIAGEAEEVARIVEDLLVAARADIGEVKIHPAQIELHDVAAEALQASTTRRSSVQALDGTGTAYADPVRVRQILRNLVTNADRYGGPHLRIEVGSRDGSASISIADDGPGVPEASVDRIFEPYQSAHEPGTEVKSIGLGLSVSRTLARLMGGDLLYGRRNGWTVFTLQLPLAENESSRPLSLSTPT
jgi:signal transduction histidine kinase